MDRSEIRAADCSSRLSVDFKDWCSEQTGYPNEMSEMALAHTVSDKVEAAYRRGDMREKRRRLMADWAAYCESPPATTKSTWCR
jgi:hypothetical protein